MNGKLIGEFKDPKTYPVFEDQFGGKSILEETQGSKFMFIFGRYFFDDLRFVISYAGINAWNRTLSDQELSSLSSCDSIPEPIAQGNLLSNKTVFSYPPSSPLIKETIFDMNSFLCTKQSSVTLIPMPIPVDTKESMIKVCQKFGSTIYIAGEIKNLADIEYIRKIMFSNKEFYTECGDVDGGRYMTWLPYTLTNTLEVRHDITDEVMDFNQFASPFSKGLTDHSEKGENMITAYFGNMMLPKKRLMGRPGKDQYCAMCAIPSSLVNTTVIKLRGVCKFSKFDREYQVSVSADGGLIYYGLQRSVIFYNYSVLAWQISDVVNPSISATFKSGFRTLGMGSNTWRVTNDMKCQPEDVSLYLSLTACQDSQFTCGDGLCIGLDERCNGVADCEDMTDELQCSVAEIESSYNKLLAPPPVEDNGKIKIVVDVMINSFNSFDIIDSSFELEFVLALKWFDSRLVFNNLREKKSSNVMAPKEKNGIWFPTIVLENTKEKVEFNIDRKSLITVERNGTGTSADSTFTENKLLYKGNENPIHYERLDNVKFNCYYQLSWYPFDTQNCYIVMGQTEILSNYVEQTPGSFSYQGPEDLTQYFVKRTEMQRILTAGRQQIQVRVTIGRRLLTIILTTILPTLLLNLIGHTANYFKEFFFEV